MRYKWAAFQWSDFVLENRWFLVFFAGFVLAGTWWVGVAQKGALVLFLSAHRSTPGDLFFRLWTQGGEVAGFLLVLCCLLLLRYRWALVLPGLTIGVALVANLTKSFFKQPRPARYFQENGMFEQIVPVPGVELHHGLTSFPSGHTMAAFAFFSFLAFCLPYKRGIAVFLFLLAFLVGVSRIYLVQHFEADVLLGAVLGVGLAAFFYRAFSGSVVAEPKTGLDRNLWTDLIKH